LTEAEKKAARLGFDGLSQANRDRITGCAAGMVIKYDFKTLYGALAIPDRRRIDELIAGLMAEQAIETDGHI
jgi:hypothetical protein